MLSINADGAYSIGLHLDHGRLRGNVLDFEGKLRARAERTVDRPNPQTGLPLLAEITEKLIASANVSRQLVCGVGVVMPGPFATHSTLAHGPTVLPGWQGIDVETVLSEKFALPVYLENDATAAALGESYFGVAREFSDVCCIFIGTGLGGGILINGQPFRGRYGNSGEIGHVPIYPSGRACYCGGRGCAEQYLSVFSAFAQHFTQETDRSAERLDAIVASGDPRIKAWLDEAAAALRLLIATLENILDTEAIILSGLVNKQVLRALFKTMDRPIVTVAHRNDGASRLLLGTAGPDVVALGAAVYPFYNLFGSTDLAPHSAARGTSNVKTL
nr:ROK family protein [Pseudohoeflea sp. DP4N28-3]